MPKKLVREKIIVNLVYKRVTLLLLDILFLILPHLSQEYSLQLCMRLILLQKLEFRLVLPIFNRVCSIMVF